MITYQEDRISKYTPEQLYNLVLDINAYPKYIPWCSASRIISENEQEIMADLVVNFSGFQEKYTSKVIKIPFSTTNNKAEILVDAIDGPFETLHNAWIFEQVPEGTKIHFEIAFSFKSQIFEKLIGIIFEKAVKRMVESFEDYANQLYGNKQ